MARGRTLSYSTKRRPRAVAPHHKMVADTALGRWILAVVLPENKMRKPDDGHTENEPGNDIFLMVPSSRGLPITIDLTGLNERELEVAEAVVSRAFALALPIVQERDRNATEQEEQDELVALYDRLHRAVPTLVVRPGYE